MTCKVSPWLLVTFCDWLSANGTQSAPQEMLASWGLEDSGGTYTGRHAFPTGTALFLSLGVNSQGSHYPSGACAKLTRAGDQDDIIRTDWRSWVGSEKDRRPHIHINGSRIFIDRTCEWERVRDTVITVIETELGVRWEGQ
jgi:hypothetical protein